MVIEKVKKYRKISMHRLQKCLEFRTVLRNSDRYGKATIYNTLERMNEQTINMKGNEHKNINETVIKQASAGTSQLNLVL